MTRGYRRATALAGAAAALLPLGFALRLAEDNQVGSSDDVSRGTFIASGLCAYFAGYAALREAARKRRAARKGADGDGTGEDNGVARQGA